MEKYISLDALVAEIKKLIRENELYLSENASDVVRFQNTSAHSVLNDLLHFIDALEVKEVELTWEDMRELYIIFAEIDVEIEFCKIDIKGETIGYYQEALKRFKNIKRNKIMRHLIDKSNVVTEIESKKKYAQTMGDNAINGSMQQFYDGMKQSCIDILSFLDTLEVKEANFDNDLFEEVYSHLDDIKDTADRMTSGNFMHHRAAIKFSANVIEKVLGLIGLKAQKGE